MPRSVRLHRVIGFGIVVTAAVWMALHASAAGSPLHTPGYFLFAAVGVALMLIP